MRLDFEDHRKDPAAWARSLDVSKEAVDLYLASEVIDLHIDSFIWTRVWGYDLTERHDHGLLRANFYSQVDFPRILEAQVTGATWVITTNPFKVQSERTTAFRNNLAQLESIFQSVSEQFSVVRTAAQYRAARAQGKHGAFLGIQGGNALEESKAALESYLDDRILRVTLVHLTESGLGQTSSPLGSRKDTGLTARGREVIEQLNAKKIFVDLAHISKRGFWDAVECSDKTQPLLVTHTGVSGVFEHWRNLDDDQLKAVAKSGGTIGVMYEPTFLGDGKFSGKLDSVAAHLEHIIKVVGPDHASLGSDWDGAISTPRDMPTCLELPRLCEALLKRGLSHDTVQKVLGENFLRVVASLRG